MRNAPIRLAPKDADRYAVFQKQMLAESPWALSANSDDDVAFDPAFLHPTLARARAFLLSLGPTLVQLLIVFPLKAAIGVGGVELGWLTPLFAVLFNFVRGATA
jgi:hypothetical protein